MKPPDKLKPLNKDSGHPAIPVLTAEAADSLDASNKDVNSKLSKHRTFINKPYKATAVTVIQEPSDIN